MFNFDVLTLKLSDGDTEISAGAAAYPVPFA
jgi:hypothetical protein